MLLSGYKEKDLTFGTWDVKHCSKLLHISLLSQLNQYRLDITSLQEMRLRATDVMDMKSHTYFQSMKRKVLDFKTEDDRICILRIKTKFKTLSFINVHAPTEEKHETELSENGRSI